MRIFLDTADTELIAKHFDTGLIDGVTTNPSLIMKSGRNPDVVYQELMDMGIPDISMEVMGNADEMIAEAGRLTEMFGTNVPTIKVPCTPDGLYVCKQLARIDVKVNVTLIFSVAQAILATKAGATYVSPFVGRVNDQSFNGMKLIEDIYITYHRHMAQAEILSASIRSTAQAAGSFKAGADIVTMPPKIFESMYEHMLTDKGMEIFENDWAQVNI